MEKEMLYRYMPYSYFKEMVEKQALTLVKPLKCWDDSYEGIIWRMVNSEKGIKMIQEWTLRYSNNKNEAIETLLSNVEYMRCQSWSRAGNDEKMWKEYAHDNTCVMVEVKREKFTSFIVEDIEYKVFKDTDDFLEGELQKFGDENGMTLHNIFSSKKDEFEFEQETRIFNSTGENVNPNDDLFDIEIRPIEEFINGVMVHPFAKPQLVRSVEEICIEKNLKFLGQSKKKH